MWGSPLVVVRGMVSYSVGYLLLIGSERRGESDAVVSFKRKKWTGYNQYAAAMKTSTAEAVS